jgi:OOP family OmpA-OmpF porin
MLNFNISSYEPGRKIIPYVLAGLGGVYEKEGEFNLQVPAGLGFYFRLAPNAFINIQSEFRYSFSDNRNNLQHGIGFTYLIGKVTEDEVKPKAEMAKPDSDNDGIPDELDLCPNAFGSKELNGCPDKDGDGVADYLDKCPEVKGLKEFGGCPDSDNDGISDNEDECPKVAGPASNKGCPVKIEEPIVLDSDGDGVEDSKDKCPKEKGSIASMGCPDTDGDGIPDKEDKCPDKPGLKIYYGCPDTDGDGIDDSRDKCPNIAGTVANEGCPEIKKEDKKTLEVAMQAVQFQTGSAVLKVRIQCCAQSNS